MSKIIYSIPSWDNWISLTTLRKFIDQTEHLDGSEKVRLVGGSLQVHLDPSKLEKLAPKNGNSTGPHLHFEGPVNPLSEKELAERVAARFPFWGVDMEDGKGTPITTKIEQPRDHLGRFTKRKDN